jgi:hypothetical protein
MHSAMIKKKITSLFQHDTSEVQGKEDKINLKKINFFQKRNRDIISPSPTPRCFIKAHIINYNQCSSVSFLLLRKDNFATDVHDILKHYLS